jgi:serine phosphatase RsbU (regulator of sigma subunit)
MIKNAQCKVSSLFLYPVCLALLVRRILIIIFIIACGRSFSQSIQLSGSVYAFHSEKVMLLKKASKNLGFEGPTSEVKISLKNSTTEQRVETDISGNYFLTLPSPDDYTLSISKQGHSTLNFMINYKNAATKTVFSLVSFVIRKDDNSENNIGALTIENGSLIYYFTEGKGKGNHDVIESNKILLEKTVVLNNSSKQNIVSSVKQTSKNTTKEKAVEEKKNNGDSTAAKQSNDLVNSISKTMSDTGLTVADAKEQIERYKQMLNALQPTDPNYELLIHQVKSAEAQLKLKENYLQAQEKELSQAKKAMTFLVLVLVAAALMIGFMVYYIREKKKFSAELSGKNTEITKINNRLISSIKYASVIQSNLLMDKDVLKKFFSNSFVYYQPKDFLSGDFYWFGALGDNTIIISADCTGHGVPGALLTVLGHGIIEEIIEKNKLSSPSAIIAALNNQLNAAFSNQNLMEYGIELTVLSVNTKNKKATFASNGHGVYKYSNNELVRYLPIIHKPIKPSGLVEYNDVELECNSGDCFYLMSDGYCDQFKGGSVKPEKFNLRRFEVLLNKISDQKDITGSEAELSKEILEWKGNADQTDDILVIGIRV